MVFRSETGLSRLRQGQSVARSGLSMLHHSPSGRTASTPAMMTTCEFEMFDHNFEIFDHNSQTQDPDIFCFQCT
jgi:hypothetical protein